MVRSCKYSPLGDRSNSGVHGEWGESQDFRSHMDMVNEELLIIPMIETQQAIDNKIMVIHSCGFESIPPDVGAYCAVNQLNEPNSDVSYFFESNGNISGGTWASLINSLSSPQPIIDRRKSNSKKKVRKKKIFFHKGFKRWALSFPVIDQYIVKQTSKKFSHYPLNPFNLRIQIPLILYLAYH